MGNEMGNGNSSGLQEEENSITQVQEKSLREAGHKDGAEGENHTVHDTEGKDYHEKVNGLASEVPNGAGDSPGVNQTTDRRELEETEVHYPAESPKFEVESNDEEGGGTNEIHSTFPTEDSKNQKHPPGYADGGQENHIVPVTEGKDYHEKENGLAFDVPKGTGEPHVLNQIPDEREQEETEIDPPGKSPKVEVVKPKDEANGETSEIQQTSPSKYLKDDMKRPGLADGSEAENQNVVRLDQGKEYHVKEIDGLASDVPKGAGDPHVINQISDESEQEETELHPPSESERIEEKLYSEADGETSDIQPTSPSKDSTDLQIAQESVLEGNLSQISDHQLEKQDSTKEEDKGEKNATFDAISSSNHPEPQGSEEPNFDQPESAKIHNDPPVQDSNEFAQKIEDILGSNLSCTSEENGQPIVTNMSKDICESAASVSDPKEDTKSDDLTLKHMAPNAGSLEIKDGDETSDSLGQKTMITSELSSGVEIIRNGQLATEMNQIRSDSLKPETEAMSMDKSLNSHLEISNSIYDCIVPNAATMLVREESEIWENKANHYPTQSCEESGNGSNMDNVIVSTTEVVVIESKPENNEKRTADYTSCESGRNSDWIEEAKISEDNHQDDLHIKDQNEASVEPCKNSQKEDVMIPESGMVTKESFLIDCKTNEVPEEKKITEETEVTTRASCDIGDDTEERESKEQCETPTLPIEQNDAFLTMSPLSLVQPQDSKQNYERESGKIQSSNDSISELIQESFSELFVTEASSFDTTNLMDETLVSVAQLAIEKPAQDLSQYTPESIVMLAEPNTPANRSSGQCATVETPAFATDDNQAQESMERFSTESNPNTSNIQAQMQKSPSFGLDLRIEARTEESDRTPLLYQDKTAIEDSSGQVDVSLGNPSACSHYGPVEDKVVTIERSDSEKSKTPFLGFLKEEEEAHMIVTPQKPDSYTSAKKTNKEFLNLNSREVASVSPKSKEKRKPRSSLFTNCMCCTTVIN